MILSQSKKLIFLHIPKTAGSSISQTIRRQIIGFLIVGGKRTDWDFHTSILSFEEKLGSLDGYFVFSFVRNPWDRLFSWFTMLNKGGDLEFKKWLLDGNHDMSSAFPEWNPQVSAQRNPQVDYMIGSSGDVRVNFIGRFENLADDYNDLCKELKVKNTYLTHLKLGKHPPYREVYDQEMVDFVSLYHRRDIEEFGYKF